MGVEAAAAVELAPGSAKIVPNDGTKVEAEQQLPSYAQHHDPLFDAALHAITFTNVLFPAARMIKVSLLHRIKCSRQVEFRLTVRICQAVFRARRIQPSGICASSPIMISLGITYAVTPFCTEVTVHAATTIPVRRAWNKFGCYISIWKVARVCGCKCKSNPNKMDCKEG